MEKMYNWEYIYRGDIYRMENGKGVLEEKNIDVAYMEDDHAWARINDILDCLYPFGITDDKEKNDAIYDRAFAKLNASLMPIDDIKEGSLYVEPSSLEVVLTPDDNSKKIRPGIFSLISFPIQTKSYIHIKSISLPAA